jgi:hypothetical protein
MVAEAFRQGGDAPPTTSAEQAYRQVREYRDKYPNLALSVWNNGVGAVPGFMGGAAQVQIFSTAAGHNQGPQVEAAPLNSVIHPLFSDVLMRMMPRDNLASASEGLIWTLADSKMQNVLLYSSAGASVSLNEALPGAKYSATWFNPASGASQPRPNTGWGKGTVLAKPDGNGWMLALKGM